MVSPDVQVRSELWKRRGCGSFLESSGDGRRDDGRLPSRRADAHPLGEMCLRSQGLKVSAQRPSAQIEPSSVFLFAAVLIKQMRWPSVLASACPPSPFWQQLALFWLVSVMVPQNNGKSGGFNLRRRRPSLLVGYNHKSSVVSASLTASLHLNGMCVTRS